jgi:hypothetical protein
MTLEGALIPACAPPLDIIPGVQQLPDSRRWRPPAGQAVSSPTPPQPRERAGSGARVGGL